MGRLLTSRVTLVAIIALAPAHSFADAVDVANAVRSSGCGDAPAVDRPLIARAELNDAARRIAHGDGLKTALSESGYRAKKSASIFVRTEKPGVVRQTLAQRFCEIVTDPDFYEIGNFRRGEETWLVLAAPFPGADDIATTARRVAELINEARSQPRRCGRKRFPATSPLSQIAALERAALAHARDMAVHDFMGHEGSDGSMVADRVTRAGYRWTSVAENVAAGQTTAEEVVDTWLASPGHCANLMNPGYSDTGIAFAIDQAGEKGIFWVQVYATQSR